MKKATIIGVIIAVLISGCSQTDSSSTLSGAAGTIVVAKRTAVGDVVAVEVTAEDSAAAATSSATASASVRADAEAAQGTGGSNGSDKHSKGSEGRRFKH